MTTRRNAVLAGLGLMAGIPTVSLRASPGEFWDQKQPSQWTPAEIEQLLSKSPWAKEASISNKTGQSGPIGGSPRASGAASRRGGVRGAGGGAATGVSLPDDPGGPWKAVTRWESALPVRDALRD